MKTTNNKFEQLQKEINGFNFIKSYPILRQLEISNTEASMIELILSYNENGKDFYMNYEDIAIILGVKLTSIKKIVQNLKKLNYVTTTVKRFGQGGGSSTTITVKQDELFKDLNNLKKINDTSTTTKKETPTQTLKIVEDVKPNEIKQPIKKQTIMKNIPTKNERSLEEELLAIDKKEKEETHSINLDEPIGVADLRPGKKVITSSPSIKTNLKMYKEDEVMGTTEAIRLLFPVVDNRTKQLQSSIDSFNGTIVDGKPFELTPAILIRILNASYPELIERVENRIIENQVA